MGNARMSTYLFIKSVLKDEGVFRGGPGVLGILL